MPTQMKRDTVTDLQEKFKKAKGIYFADYLGLNVADIMQLRSDFRKDNVEFAVVKNTLAKLSAEKAGLGGLDELFEGPTAIAFSYDDPISPARVLKRFKESHALPELKAFVIERRLINREAFDDIAQLPSRDALLARFMSLLSSPVANMTLALRNQFGKLINVLDKLQQTKQT